MTVDTPRFDLHEPISGRWRFQPGQVTERAQIAAIVAAKEA